MKGSHSLVVLGLVALMASFGFTGCQNGAALSRSKGESRNTLVGEWVELAGNRVRFTEDVFYTDAADEGRPRFRYKITSDTRMSLTPILIQNGVERGDTEKTRAERYSFGGDVLKLESHGLYYRPGSAAFKAALSARQGQVDAEANTAESRLGLSACSVVRSNYVSAFEAWFETAYPDRASHGYTVGRYIDLKRLDMDWDFAQVKMRVGVSGYEAAARAYVADVMPEEYEGTRLVGWVDAGTCPSRGTYVVKWDLDQQLVPQIECSVHGVER